MLVTISASTLTVFHANTTILNAVEREVLKNGDACDILGGLKFYVMVFYIIQTLAMDVFKKFKTVK